jgi:hypothetical protein
MRPMGANDASSALPRRAAGVEIVRHGAEPRFVIAAFLGVGSLARDDRSSLLRTPLAFHA